MKKLALFFTALIMTGCSSSFESVKQVDAKAFVLVSGNFDGTYLQIDNSSPIDLNDSSVERYKENGVSVIKFQVSKGTHTVEIKRSDVVIVKRKIYVTDGNTFEIQVP